GRLAQDQINVFRRMLAFHHQIGETGEHDHGFAWLKLLDDAGELVTVYLRHRAIGNNKVESLRAKSVHGLTSAAGSGDDVTVLSQVGTDNFADGGMIVDHQNPKRPHTCLGSEN